MNRIVIPMCVLMAVGVVAAEEKSATTRKSNELVPINIALPKPAWIGTMKDLPKGVEQAPTKPRPPLMLPAGTANLAMNRPVTSSDKEVLDKLPMITDGDKEGAASSFVELARGVQWVQIDLGASADIRAVVVWHCHDRPNVYRDVVVQVSDDVDFIDGVRTIFNNDLDNSAGLGLGKDREYVEHYSGKLIEAPGGIKARYIRLHSNGNIEEEMNRYVEVEVYGSK